MAAAIEDTKPSQFPIWLGYLLSACPGAGITTLVLLLAVRHGHSSCNDIVPDIALVSVEKERTAEEKDIMGAALDLPTKEPGQMYPVPLPKPPFTIQGFDFANSTLFQGQDTETLQAETNMSACGDKDSNWTY
jgi:hypothetical protein